MMKLVPPFFNVLLVLGLVVVRGAFGIASANWGISEGAPSAVGYSIELDHVYSYKGASAVAVGRYWLLTAEHVADDEGSGTIDANGMTYLQQEIISHPSTDLSLIRYDKPFPGFYLLGDTLPVGSEVVVAGFGFPGNSFVGWNSAFFDQVIGSRMLRWGTNRIDAQVTLNGDYSGTGFRCRLSAVESGLSTLYECGVNTYDSGGGAFCFVDGAWRLVGILGNRLGSEGHYTGFNGSTVSHYKEWIVDAVYHSVVSQEIDSDGDGVVDADEWVGGTNPLLADELLQVSASPSFDALMFPSSTNREYLVEYTADLSEEPLVWQTDEGWFEGSISQTVYGVSPAVPNPAFFRVRARLP